MTIQLAIVGKGAVGQAIANAYVPNPAYEVDIFDKSTIEHAFNKQYDILIYAGVPGVKYLANANPVEDMKAIQIARDNILNIDAKKKVLISTIDASFDLGDSQASVYGIHRRMLENMVAKSCRIIRLPALFGSTVVKNVWFDLVNQKLPDQLSDSYFEYLQHALTQLQKANHQYLQFQIVKKDDKIDYIPSKQEWLNHDLGLHIAMSSDSEMVWFDLDTIDKVIQHVLNSDIATYNCASFIRSNHVAIPLSMTHSEFLEMHGIALPEVRTALRPKYSLKVHKSTLMTRSMVKKFVPCEVS